MTSPPEDSPQQPGQGGYPSGGYGPRDAGPPGYGAGGGGFGSPGYGPPGAGGWGGQPAGVSTCAFHPDRPTSLHCTRCGRPACPECLTPASVGFQCKACIAQDRPTQRAARTVAGAALNQPTLVTSVLIGLNVLVFVITAAQSKSVTNFSGFVFNQAILVPDLVDSGQVWRLATTGFIHLSLLHIALNMISLYMLGNPLERIFGRGRLLVTYLLALLGGSAAVLLFSGQLSATGGASGAIFGLMGALVVTFRRLQLDLRQLTVVLAINLFISFRVSGISWQGHIGGLVVGAIVGALMVYPSPQSRKLWQVGGCIAVFVALVIVIGIQMATSDPLACDVLSDGRLVPCR